MDFKYGVGTGQTVEEKLDWTVTDSTRFTFGVAASNFDIIPKSTVLDGADRNRSIVDQAGALSYYTALDPATGLPDPTSQETVNRAIDLHYQQYGAYAEGSHRFLDNLRLIAGVRVDINTRFDATPVSPRAALVYSPISELTLKYIFTQAYVAPAPYFFHNVFDNGVQISAGNSELKPETAMSNEVNATWQTENLLVSASGYFNQQNDLLLTAQTELPETVLYPMVYINPTDATQTRRVARAINLGSSRAFGADIAARVNLGPLSLRGSYSFVDFKRTTGATTSQAGQDLGPQRPGGRHLDHHPGPVDHPQPGVAIDPRRDPRGLEGSGREPQDPLRGELSTRSTRRSRTSMPTCWPGT